MTLAVVVRWAFSSVEVVDLSCSSSNSHSKQVTTVRELNLTTALDLETLVVMERLRQKVEKDNFVLNCHDNMESRRMESHREGILLERIGDLECLVNVVPYFDSLISGAGYNQLFTDAHIKTCNLLVMEAAVDKVKLRDGISVVIQWDVGLHDLVALGSEVDIVFSCRKSHGGDIELHIANHILHLNIIRFLRNKAVSNSWILTLVIDKELSSCSIVAGNNETTAESNDCLDLKVFFNRRLWDVVHESTISLDQDNLADLCTQDKASISHPGVTAVLSCDLSVLVVELGMLLLELIGLDLVELVGVNSCNHDAVILVVGKAHLEVIVWLSIPAFLVDGEGDSCDSNVDLCDNLELVPVPKDQGPVGLTCQGDDVLSLLLLLGAEGAAEEFL